jgi:hypothetical protein
MPCKAFLFSPLFQLRVPFSIIQPSSSLVLRLYAERFARRKTLIGTHEMIPVESQTGSFVIRNLACWTLNISGVDVPFVLVNGDRQAGQLSQPGTLYLTVVVSPNATSYAVPTGINATNLRSTEVGPSPLTEATSSVAQVSANTARSTVDIGSETLSPPTDRLPSTPMLAAADQRAGMSPAETALNRADAAMTTINTSKTWGVALERIKWVMDTLSPVAGVRRNVLFVNP